MRFAAVLTLGVVALVSGCAMDESRPPEQLMAEVKRLTQGSEMTARELLPDGTAVTIDRQDASEQ